MADFTFVVDDIRKMNFSEGHPKFSLDQSEIIADFEKRMFKI
jgi:hypothetical protein